ncbi:hypothetical protein MRB53_021342 [Persea americana]|uniref:Uncharacterized protein n=1 Tax=Persea americana TaxID=3435 RepID=A0ACC2L3N5_PERAE|nr:hypothetical protein MRB53_021342 [Persea americana]
MFLSLFLSFCFKEDTQVVIRTQVLLFPFLTCSFQRTYIFPLFADLSIMEIILAIIQIIPNLCTQISHQTDYVRHLQRNVEALMEEASKLKALCEDTESEGREASRARKRLTNQAQTWLDQARTIVAEIDSIKLQFDQRRTFCNGCFPDLSSHYTLGKRAFEKLKDIPRFINERSLIKLVAMSSPPRVMEMDMPTSSFSVGQSSSQRTMEKIWDLLHDEHTSVISVYGMGGIGKTTLMKAINNKLQATSEFDYVIWVTVSKELNLERVQEEIMGRLQLNFSEQDSYSNRSMQLRQYLTDTSVDNLVDASNKGHRIIEILKRRCLLEEGIRLGGNVVKMHDIVRDLALYMASSSCDEGPKILVKAGFGKGLKEPPLEETWREFARISLMMNGITELPIKPECPNLVSLFLSYNPITAVHHSFFEFMPALQVLDLSFTSITSLSVSSSSLLNLRALILTGCHTLTEVSFLGQLKELQFLDIKSSGIRSLPKDMQNLVKLKKLNMSNLQNFRTLIPSSGISGLSSLEDLRLQKTKVNWAKGSELAVENDATLGEVAKLKQLTILKITIEDFDCIEEDLFLQQWSKLKKFKVVIGPSLDEPNYMDCMKHVHICGGNNYPHGVKVMVTHTEGLGLINADVKDVFQLVGVANGLRMLNIDRCKKMERILDWSDVGEDALQNIEKLELRMLPKLQKLFKGQVPQQCLRKLSEIHLRDCDQLKSLFSSEMVQNLDQLQTVRVSYCEELEEIIEEHAFHYCNQDVGHAIAALAFAAMPLGWDVKLLDGLGFFDLQRVMGSELSLASKSPPARLKVGSPTWNPSTPIAFYSYFPTIPQNFQFIIRRTTKIVKKLLTMEMGFSVNPFCSSGSLFLGTLYKDLTPDGEGSV